MATLTSGAYPIASKTSNRGFKSVVGLKEHPLAQAALMAIRRNGGSAWWVPDSLTNSGVYTESTGVTPVSAVGDVIGLLTDRSYGAGNLGPELVTNGDFSNGTTWWTLANGATVSAGQLTLPGANATAISTASNCVSGKAYQFQFDYVSGSGAQFINVQAGSASFGVATTTTARRYSVIIRASATDAIKIWQDGGVAGSAVIDNISVREVLGNHATQATTANKPVIARVPKRLGPELVTNGDFSGGTTGWSALNSALSVVSGELVVTSTTGGYSQGYTSVATTVGRTYLVTGSLRRGTETANAGLTAQDSSGNSIATGVDTSSTTAVSLSTTFTAVTTTSRVVVFHNTGTPTGTIIVDNVSVREVLEWSNAIKFDGSNDHLVTTHATGTTGWVSVALVADALGNMAACGSGAVNVGVDAGVAIKLRSTGAVWFRTATTTAQSEIQAAASYSVGTPVVLTMAWTPSLLQAWVNGVSVGTVSSPNVGASGGLYIGCHSGSLAEMFNGKVIDLDLGQAILTDADRKVIERNMASRAGATYLG